MKKINLILIIIFFLPISSIKVYGEGKKKDFIHVKTDKKKIKDKNENFKDRKKKYSKYDPIIPTEQDEENWTFFSGDDSLRISLQSPEWWSFIRGEFYFWQARLKGTITSGGQNFKGTKLDDRDLGLSNNKTLYRGELRIGPAPIHLRFSYFSAKFIGNQTSSSAIVFRELTVPPSTLFESKIELRDFFVDLNIAAFYHRDNQKYDLKLQFYIGMGYLNIKEEINIPGVEKKIESTDVITWHYGVELRFSPFRFLSVYGDLNFGNYKSNELELSRFTVFRTRAGFHFNITPYLKFGLEYRYEFYRVNKHYTIAKLQIYGPSLFVILSF